MQLMAMLAPLLGLIAFVGFVWLVVVAFRKHAGWGLGVLLLSPIAAVVFAIKYWEESRKPFLIYAGSCVGSLVIVMMTFASLGGFEMLGMAARLQQGETLSNEDTAAFMQKTMDRMESSGLLSDQEKKDLEMMRERMEDTLGDGTADATPAVSEESGQSSPTVVPASKESSAGAEVSSTDAAPVLRAKGPRPSPTGDIAVRDARHFIGARVKVLDHNGHERQGILSEASSSTIVLVKYLTGGTVTYEVRTSEIKSLQVLRP